MFRYILKRLLLMIPTIFAVSIISFVVIQLPPGDFLTTYISNREASGETVDQGTVENLKSVMVSTNPCLFNTSPGSGGL